MKMKGRLALHHPQVVKNSKTSRYGYFQVLFHCDINFQNIQAENADVCRKDVNRYLEP
jgi:hypothetical protein